MENAESGEPSTEDAWNARDLGALLIALLGAWLIVEAALIAVHLLSEPLVLGVDWNMQVIYLVVGTVTLFAQRRLARLLFPRPVAAPPPQDVVPVLAAGIALTSGWIISVRIEAVVRELLADLERGADRWSLAQPWADGITATVALVVLARAGVLARWWGQWNTQR